MKTHYLLVLCSIVVMSLLGCNGSRNSYESLLDSGSDKFIIVLKVGEEHEVLAVGDGFPGWWGYYPAIGSSDRGIATVDCEAGRSFIPFREPGIVFGGERCYLKAKTVGVAWLFIGNKYSIYHEIREADLGKLPDDLRFSAKLRVNNRIIKLKVVSDFDD